MLKNTFVHIPGIGAKTEERLWQSGIQSWDDVTSHLPMRLSKNRINTLKNYISESEIQFKNSNPKYFADLLPANLQWRLFPEFRTRMVYLDIETTGLEEYYNEITTIATYDGQSVSYYINGQNLDDFVDDIQNYNAIVSYNGKCFDIPFIENYFGITLNHAHLDLRYILASLGFKGGLKGCEIQLGLDRGDLKGVDGYFAVLLWHDFKNNNNRASLETLLAYNIQDTLVLETLMCIAYNMKLKLIPYLEIQEITLPEQVDNPFKADLKTVERIKDSMFPGSPNYW